MASTANHYEAHSAETYEEAYFYEPGKYMNHLVDLVTRRMEFDDNRPRHMLDIGGGTGNFARALVQNNNLHVTVIEPFLEETNNDELAKSDKLGFVKAPAEIFLSSQLDDWRKQPFHQVLIKETIHHIDEKLRVDILKAIYNELQPFVSEPSPSILILTRPQIEIDYPLWDAARQVWKENQPSLQQLTSELESAGFVDIKHTVEKYDGSISLDRWKKMVKNRFWSTFANFSDDELEKGCQLLARERPPDEAGVIHFEDRLLFITGRKIS
jgi:cyclopropane fatty-acyl-phospholipid synthase-like methyltransferase